MKNLYVSQLPTNTQQSILNEITIALSQHNLSSVELSEAIENAMSSRVSDLQDTININSIVQLKHQYLNI